MRALPAAPGGLSTVQRDMLHSLGYLYLLHGQRRRALILLLLAARGAPQDLGLLRTLAFALISCDDPERALAVLEQIEALTTRQHIRPADDLLRSRALLQQGRLAEARVTFQRFIVARTAAASAA
jgi:type III secretion protein Y